MSWLMDVSLGSSPADLLLFGNLVNVYVGTVSESYIGVKDRRIAYIGSKPIPSRKRVNLDSKYILPAYIDGHVHIESSLMIPSKFAAAVIPRGTCCVVADPHEIANVRGVEGIRFMIKDSARTPLRVYFMIPSCVPATNLETSGAEIGLQEIEELKKFERILGLGEVMNFPAVINSETGILDKIKACEGMVVDGHAPGLRGEKLCAYVSAGIHSDHESVSQDEAREKLSFGMWIMIREGSTAKNLSALAKIVSKGCPERAMLVTDDKHAEDLLAEGHMDHCLRRAVEEGIDPVDAVRMASLKPAEYFALGHLGGIAPGKFADMVIVNDLKEFEAKMVLIDGKIVAKDGEYIGGISGPVPKESVKGTVNVKELRPTDLSITCSREGRDKGQVMARVIGIVMDQIVTEELRCQMEKDRDEVKPDPERDILKICVVERHRGTGRIGKGFVKGFGLREGAISSTVAHDSHNVIAVGTDDCDICKAVNRLRQANGGFVIVSGNRVLDELPLPVAGLMTTLDVKDVAEKSEGLKEVTARLGSKLRNPFMTLSFLALPVIPKLKITDYGLVDVEKFEVVDLFVN